MAAQKPSSKTEPLSDIRRVRGWFYIGKNYPKLNLVWVDKETYKHSIKDLDITKLEVLWDIERLYGTMLTHVKVVAVIDVSEKGSLPIPFFIERQKAEIIDKQKRIAGVYDKLGSNSVNYL